LSGPVKPGWAKRADPSHAREAQEFQDLHLVDFYADLAGPGDVSNAGHPSRDSDDTSPV
jgi:hypothetical protein